MKPVPYFREDTKTISKSIPLAPKTMKKAHFSKICPEKFAGSEKMSTFAIPFERKGSSKQNLVPQLSWQSKGLKILVSLVRFPVAPLKTLVDAFYGGFAFENVLHMYYILQVSPKISRFPDSNTNFICTTAFAESFNAKIKAFRAQLRGVTDLKFFFYRLTKLFAQPPDFAGEPSLEQYNIIHRMLHLCNRRESFIRSHTQNLLSLAKNAIRLLLMRSCLMPLQQAAALGIMQVCLP